MLCRKCGDNLRVRSVEEGRSSDKTGNPTLLITFLCRDCQLEFDGYYQLVGLWCLDPGPNGGGGEFPLDYDEGHRMFKPPKKVRKGSRTKKR